ncbi:MAG: hypothetical protein NTX00_00285 [Candidatus Parcubacteria bacterium]|nr:hypothetical protein [Candidatus Parcubacteria bacterium]
MNLKEALEQIDIIGKKADIYLACLEMGGATAYSIAKKVGLKRPTVYDILSQLLKEGLVYKSLKRNKKYYFPADPGRLLKKAKEKEENIKAILPELESLYNAPKIKPTIKYFEGKEGIKEMYNDSLKSLKKGDEILGYVGEGVLQHLPKYSDEYVAERVAKGIRFRGIYKKEKGIMEYMAKNQEQLRTVKLLDPKDFPVNNETNIYANKIAIASYGKEMFAMIIESEEIARAQRAIFELAWRGAGGLE